jgi:hypothetical protein
LYFEKNGPISHADDRVKKILERAKQCIPVEYPSDEFPQTDGVYSIAPPPKRPPTFTARFPIFHKKVYGMYDKYLEALGDYQRQIDDWTDEMNLFFKNFRLYRMKCYRKTHPQDPPQKFDMYKHFLQLKQEQRRKMNRGRINLKVTADEDILEETDEETDEEPADDTMLTDYHSSDNNDDDEEDPGNAQASVPQSICT